MRSHFSSARTALQDFQDYTCTSARLRVARSGGTGSLPSWCTSARMTLCGLHQWRQPRQWRHHMAWYRPNCFQPASGPNRVRKLWCRVLQLDAWANGGFGSKAPAMSTEPARLLIPQFRTWPTSAGRSNPGRPQGGTRRPGLHRSPDRDRSRTDPLRRGIARRRPGQRAGHTVADCADGAHLRPPGDSLDCSGIGQAVTRKRPLPDEEQRPAFSNWCSRPLRAQLCPMGMVLAHPRACS
jgi:hypothetical protein